MNDISAPVFNFCRPVGHSKRMNNGQFPINALFGKIPNNFTSDWEKSIDQLLSLNPEKNAYHLDDERDPIPEEIYLSAVLFIINLQECEFPAPSRITVTPDAEIVIEWHDNDTYLEAEISEPFMAECMYSEPGNSIEHWTLRLDDEYEDFEHLNINSSEFEVA